jgi:hypothetical protein
MSHPGFNAITAAKEWVLAWAHQTGIPIHTIEYVATFQDWDDGIGVWVFYETERDLAERTENDGNERVKERLLAALSEVGYPFARFPNVVFEFDSHENVLRNYEGSYFYRLR